MRFRQDLMPAEPKIEAFLTHLAAIGGSAKLDSLLLGDPHCR